MAELLSNNAASTLTAAIPDAVVTSCTVANGAVFPATGNFRIIVDSELMLCTARAANVLTVTRGVETTTAVAHSNGAAVTHVLTKGGLDQYLKENTNPPSARVAHASNQTTTTAVPFVLAFGAERWDTDTIHDNVTNNSRLTCRTAGKYQITGQVAWALNATGVRETRIRQNGGTALAIESNPANSASLFTIQTITTLYDLAVGDYVELVVTQTSGGNLDVTAGAIYSPEFMMVKVA